MIETQIGAQDSAGSALDLHTKIVLQDGQMVVGRSQDCTPIAEYAKARQREGHHGSSEMRFAASIPYVIVEKYCNENKLSFAEVMADPVHIKRICNNPDNASFRIWPGKL